MRNLYVQNRASFAELRLLICTTISMCVVVPILGFLYAVSTILAVPTAIIIWSIGRLKKSII